MQVRALFIALFLAVPGSASAQPTVERYLVLRDGSILRLAVVDETWQVPVLRNEGAIETAPVRLSQLKRLMLTPERIFDKKRIVLELVSRLGDDDFNERERAQGELLRRGPKLRPEIEMVRDLYTDPEIKARLRVVLEQWPEEKGARPEPAFDVLTTGETLWGDAGDGGIPVRVDGRTYRLGRKDVAALTETSPEGGLTTSPAMGRGLRRLQQEEFPRGCVEEGFETTPDGRRLKVGENIQHLFVRKGFVLSTSVKSSFVSVNDFIVQGKSKGLSAATHQPLFTGEITITFVKPGHEQVPAGVTHFGCWLAWIEPHGTALHAYDFYGREIGNLTTTRTGHEFVGMSSPVPMHMVRIVPNPKIDPDYTLDDFIYSPPQTADVAHPEKYTVHFANGEQLVCKDVAFEGDAIRLIGMPASLPDQVRPAAGLVRLVAPDGGKGESAPPPGVFAEIEDGSVIFGSRPADPRGAPVFARRPGLLREPEKIVALWASTHLRTSWPLEGPGNYPALGKTGEPRTEPWRVVADVRLTDEGAQWAVPEGPGQKEKMSFFDLPPLLLKESASTAPGSWHVRTRLGEEIELGTAEAPRLAGRMSQGLVATWLGKEVRLTPGEITLVYRIPKVP